MLRRLGVRREERVAMIMLDTVDFPVVFLGAIRAGIVPVPLNTLLTADQYAYILADSPRARAVRLPRRSIPSSRMWSAACPISSMSWSPAPSRTATSSSRKRSQARSDQRYRRPRRIRTSRHSRLYSSGSTGMPKGRAPHPFQSAGNRGTLTQNRCSASARAMWPLRGKAVLRLWSRQRADLPDVGRRQRDSCNSERPTPARMFDLMNRYNPRSSTACRRCSRRCSTTRP
ncbi:AMP-binding protein [Bradyrhizobium betae]